MARRPRREFEGAIYHVFNRVKPGRDVFGGAAPARLFEECLFEACSEFGWKLHAYCIVRDGFHIALATPRANLVAGMHWFQSTFAKRLQPIAGMKGALFQGRYRALPVEPGLPLANLVNYIHLKPAAAGLVEAGLLGLFRWSSLRRFLKGEGPAFLTTSGWIDQIKEPGVSKHNIGTLETYLVGLAREPERNLSIGMRGMTRGPVIGSRDFRDSISNRTSCDPCENDWNEALDRILQRSGKTRADFSNAPKGAPWKMEIALELRNDAGAPLDWLARELSMGAVNSVSHYLWLARKASRELQSA